MKNLIKCIGLKKVYRVNSIETWALRGIDLEIEEGEFIAVAGPSGSGKTTLLNLIGGLDVPTSGYVYVGEQNLNALSREELADFRLRNIGFIFQTYNLIEVLTAYENTEFVLLLQGIRKEIRRRKALEILKKVGLAELKNRKPTELSGGQQQRVAVARAIVSEPKLILADEPTANLDSGTATQLMELMKSLNREKGITFIFSTHDRLVMDYADRIVELRDGLIIEDRRKEI